MWGLRSWIRSLKSKSSKAQFLVSILKTTHINCLDNTHFLQKIDIILAKHINTARLTFPWYSLQCDLYSCGVLLQWLSLHVLFFWWTHPRGVVATFQHLLHGSGKSHDALLDEDSDQHICLHMVHKPPPPSPSPKGILDQQ